MYNLACCIFCLILSICFGYTIYNLAENNKKVEAGIIAVVFFISAIMIFYEKESIYKHNTDILKDIHNACEEMMCEECDIAITQSDAKFCANCGSTLKKQNIYKCHNCDTIVEKTDNYCYSCGTKT